MYEEHFHFKQTPFSIAPDPEFLYLSDGHKEALAHLTYGFSHGGFVLITGEVGTGKTTLLRNLVNQTPEALDVAFVLNPRLTVRELLETLCDELGVAYPSGSNPSVKQYIDVLNEHLLQTHREGRGTVVIIDEAQNLSPAVLEQIRLLTNLETDKRKLLRIILIGQPELAELLARTELRQLAQRITARYHLKSLSRDDTYAYVVHRLARAGGNPHLFTRPALWHLYRISRGIPRLVNLVADRALLGAYAEGRQRVTARLVNRAASEVLSRPLLRAPWLAAGIGAMLAAGAASAYFLLPRSEQPIPAPPAVTASGAGDSSVAAAPEQVPATPRTESGNDPEPAASAEPVAVAPTSAAPAQAGADTAQSAAPPPAPVPLERPDITNYRSQRLAYEAVLKLWGADFDGWENVRIPCNYVPRAGLQCLSGTGSWDDIRRLNLPVILELWDRGAAPYYAAVTDMQDDTLTLHLGEQILTLRTSDLRDVWFGSYVLLWQMPPSYSGALKRGDRHPSVAWLRDRLQQLGMPAPPADDRARFDENLQNAVVEFQREEHLVADGIVGPATWIRLGARLNLPAPALQG